MGMYFAPDLESLFQKEKLALLKNHSDVRSEFKVILGNAWVNFKVVLVGGKPQ